MSDNILFKSHIIFDMDGVITNTMPYHFLAWKQILKKYAISATRFDIYTREGQPGIKAVEEIFAHYEKRISPASAKKVLREKEKCFLRIVKKKFIPGARTFIRTLHKNNFILSLVTGTSRQEIAKILPPHIYKLFTVIVTGDDVIHGKPHPEPYLKAINKLKIKPSQALVIENAPYGIISAKRARLKCIALETSLPKEYLKEADRVFKNFNELNRTMKFVHKKKVVF